MSEDTCRMHGSPRIVESRWQPLDRPYKKGKTFKRSINGFFFRKDEEDKIGIIDPDIMDVFIWDKVYGKYAPKNF
jgi:hypothetical protein